MEFRILGPLEVVDNGRVVDLGSRKQRALLTVLLLRRGDVVAVDELIESLGSEPPRTAETTLRAYVSRLRASLGPNRLQTRSRGYLLTVAPDEVDADRFESLTRAGRFDEALSLWRGAPLADVAYESFAQTEIARLEELRLAAIEERVEADLAAGRHSPLVAELEALVSTHPPRERLRAQPMLALYRAGRQAEALESFSEARRLLGDELGLQPGTA